MTGVPMMSGTSAIEYLTPCSPKTLSLRMPTAVGPINRPARLIHIKQNATDNPFKFAGTTLKRVTKADDDVSAVPIVLMVYKIKHHVGFGINGARIPVGRSMMAPIIKTLNPASSYPFFPNNHITSQHHYLKLAQMPVEANH